MLLRSWTRKVTPLLVLLVFVLLTSTGHFFEVLSLPFLLFQRVRQVFALCLHLHCCSVFYASAFWRRKIIASYEHSEGQGIKCTSLPSLTIFFLTPPLPDFSQLHQKKKPTFSLTLSEIFEQ